MQVISLFRRFAIRAIPFALLVLVTNLHEARPVHAQQPTTESIQEQLLDSWGKLMKDAIAIRKLLPEKSTAENAEWTRVANESSWCADNAASLANSAFAIVHLYRAMSPEERAANTPFVMSEIDTDHTDIDWQFQLMAIECKDPERNAVPGLEAAMTTARDDIQHAEELMKSDQLLAR